MADDDKPDDKPPEQPPNDKPDDKPPEQPPSNPPAPSPPPPPPESQTKDLFGLLERVGGNVQTLVDDMVSKRTDTRPTKPGWLWRGKRS